MKFIMCYAQNMWHCAGWRLPDRKHLDIHLGPQKNLFLLAGRMSIPLDRDWARGWRNARPVLSALRLVTSASSMLFMSQGNGKGLQGCPVHEWLISITSKLILFYHTEHKKNTRLYLCWYSHNLQTHFIFFVERKIFRGLKPMCNYINTFFGTCCYLHYYLIFFTYFILQVEIFTFANAQQK